MNITYSSFFTPVVLGITTSTLLTIPATTTTTMLRGGRIRLTNTTVNTATVTLYAVPSGALASVGNTFFPTKYISANDFTDVDVPIMPAGSTLQAIAGTAASITAQMISGAYFS